MYKLKKPVEVLPEVAGFPCVPDILNLTFGSLVPTPTFCDVSIVIAAVLLVSSTKGWFVIVPI